MHSDRDIGWAAASVIWRTGEHQSTTVTERLARRVRRQSDSLRLLLAGEIVLTLVILVASGAVIIRQAGAGAFRVGAMVVLYTAAVWAFTLWNRRGIWAPYGETTADFVALLRVRAQRRIRTAWFSQIVITAAALLLSREMRAAWRAGQVSLVDWVWIYFGVYTVAVIVWSVWYRRQARREVRELDALQRDLTPIRPVAE